jgi:hypothetical protein
MIRASTVSSAEVCCADSLVISSEILYIIFKAKTYYQEGWFNTLLDD